MLHLLTDFFPPGYRAGGPVRSAANIAILVGKSRSVRVWTADRDLGEAVSFQNIALDVWSTFAAGVQVRYATPEKRQFLSLVRLWKQEKMGVWYLNSMFSTHFTIFPLLAYQLGWIKGRVVLAPRGMLLATALQFKSFKKQLFLFFFKLFRWQYRVVFHATNEREETDIRRIFGTGAQVQVVKPLPEISLLNIRQQLKKDTNETRIVILGRVHPIKNTLLALSLLRSVKSPLVVEVIGALEDQDYVHSCKAMASTLPSHIQAIFYGDLPPVQVHERLQQTHFMYLLTQGENFGHAIFEALALGKPVIISDQTPWRQLEKSQAGWDLDLSGPEMIQHCLNEAISMSDEAYQNWSEGAYQLAKQYIAQSDWEKEYLELLGLSS